MTEKQERYQKQLREELEQILNGNERRLARAERMADRIERFKNKVEFYTTENPKLKYSENDTIEILKEKRDNYYEALRIFNENNKVEA